MTPSYTSLRYTPFAALAVPIFRVVCGGRQRPDRFLFMAFTTFVSASLAWTGSWAFYELPNGSS